MNKAKELKGMCEGSNDLISRLEKFAGTKIKPGRNTIKGYPVDLEDNPEGTYVSMTAVDQAAATGLMKLLRAAKFKVTRDNDTEITVE